jgi:uncharacterized lipoprotein YmbA
MLRNIVFIVLLLSISACGTSPKSKIYMLSAEDDSVTYADNKEQGIAVGVWTVMMPEYLDRAEIVTRDNPFEIELADFNRWAVDLDRNMTRLIAGELARRLKTDRVVISPWAAYRKNDYQVKIYIDRFDGEIGGEVKLSGVWSLLSAEGNEEKLRKVFTFKTRANGKDYIELVAALSKLTVQLSEQIANGIATDKK